MLKPVSKFFKSNWVVLLVITLFFIPQSREWLQRQIAFVPSIIDEKDRVGLEHPYWLLKDKNGNIMNLANEENKVIFINFWATWCPPCRAELPYIKQLYTDYQDKMLFVFISNEPKELVSDFFKSENIDLPIYELVSSPPKELRQSNSIPSTYILDSNGKIAVFKTGAARWSSSRFYKKLDQLIDDSTPE